ncbi:hypothetical protein HNQ04_003508 [Deinococcus radiopugnans ATCC 19172]|uniref:Transposase n=1 Tax=Deinococcus radiopugnans ATCC 19172 TaxID=585398 RepID=A0ABR6NW03_9DEIO|nr:hypothetical protein [Deinococcus radiopugnans ATCC 19172]
MTALNSAPGDGRFRRPSLVGEGEGGIGGFLFNGLPVRPQKMNLIRRQFLADTRNIYASAVNVGL